MAILSLSEGQVNNLGNFTYHSSQTDTWLIPFRALEAHPNAAHKLLANLAVPSYLKTIAPSAKSFDLITQNVDRLSIRALETVASERSSETQKEDRPNPESVIEMHGKLFDVKCTTCDHISEDLSNPLCPALGAADALLGDYQDAGSKTIDIPETELPRCSACGALGRPGVVWFEEKPVMLEEINSLVLKADMCLVVGTSSTVSGHFFRIAQSLLNI